MVLNGGASIGITVSVIQYIITASLVNYHNVLTLLGSTLLVKDVTTMESHDPKTESTDELNSVKSVQPTFLLPNLAGASVQFANIKCTNDKITTPHMYVKLTPEPNFEIDLEQIAGLTKRLTLCTLCGTMRLIN